MTILLVAAVAGGNPRRRDENPSVAAVDAADVFLVDLHAAWRPAATMSPGNFSTAAAHSSTPVAPRCADAFDFGRVGEIFPVATPAIRRAIETG